jgi:hypothetical protein
MGSAGKPLECFPFCTQQRAFPVTRVELNLVRQKKHPVCERIHDLLKSGGGSSVAGASREEGVTGEQDVFHEKAKASRGVSGSVQHLEAGGSQGNDVPMVQ